MNIRDTYLSNTVCVDITSFSKLWTYNVLKHNMHFINKGFGIKHLIGFLHL